MIEREEMQEVAKRYREPVVLILGSHSALDAASGARNYGFRRVIYTTKERAIIYLQNPIVGKTDEKIDDLPKCTREDMVCVYDPRELKKKEDWKTALIVFDKYPDVFKYMDELIELECLQVPNRAFSVYLGGDEHCSRIEKEFSIPIVGSRRLLKIENRGEIERDYYWFAEKAGIPYPKSYRFNVHKDGIRFKEYIGETMILKCEHAKRELERAFIFAADSNDLEEKVRVEMELGNLNKNGLKKARVEQIVLGPHANFNFFLSPINTEEEWGDVDDFYAELYNMDLNRARFCLANEFLSIDERRETILDGLKRLPIDVQQKIKKVPSFEVTCHLAMSLRESLLKDVHKVANAFLLATKEYEPPGIIGAWCLQTLITWGRVPGKAVEFGLYDVPMGKDVYAHIPVTQDVATRHGGGTNVHMGVGSQYANAKYNRRMSTGDRIALEMTRALNSKKLDKIVT
jgi:5-formaminoimidazole-4-carboxamide-1-(beta)-D-ribofuranosyl 5'-monophosphate synthetase